MNIQQREIYEVSRTQLVELENEDTGGSDYIMKIMCIAAGLITSGEFDEAEVTDWACNIAAYIADYMKPEGEGPMGGVGSMNELLVLLDKTYRS